MKYQWDGYLPLPGTGFETKPIFLPVEIVEGAPVHATLKSESTQKGNLSHFRWSLVQRKEDKTPAGDARCTWIGEEADAAKSPVR